MGCALFGELGLNCLEQLPIQDGWLLARADLALVDHFADVEPITQQMREGASGERDAADRVSIGQRPDLGDDAASTQVGQQRPDAAELEIALKDAADALGFRLVDPQPALAALITERHHAADPQSLAL